MPNLTSRITGFVVGDDLQVNRKINGVPSGDSLVKAWFTVKQTATDSDASAIFQKIITATLSETSGKITDTGEDGTGRVMFFLRALDTGGMTGGIAYYFDIQVKTATGMIYTPEVGTIQGTQQITKATT